MIVLVFALALLLSGVALAQTWVDPGSDMVETDPFTCETSCLQSIVRWRPGNVVDFGIAPFTVRFETDRSGTG